MSGTMILLFIITVITLVYLWCRHTYGYWKRKCISYEEPYPFIGNIQDVITQKKNFSLHFSDVYSHPAYKTSSVVGVYILNKPGLVIRDVELIKSILVKDFNKFSNRYGTADRHRDALGYNNLFFIRNPEWKEARNKLTPVFTSGKLKQMFPLMQEIGLELEAYLKRTMKTQTGFVTEIKDVCALFTTDMIASIAFGIRSNSLQDPNAEFRAEGKRITQMDLMRGLHMFVAFFLPKYASLLRVKVFDEQFSKFLRNSVGYVMSERERTGTIRNDLIDILVGLKKEAALDTSGKHFANNNDILVAQAALFLTAGFETSASTMSFALYELVKSPEHLNRLRREICDALLEENGKISYEKLNSLEYLSMVVDEVLRLYPIMPFLDRQYEKVKGEDDFSLSPYADFTLPNGMPVFIPIFGIHRDPKYWPNPNKFDPERFSPENKKTHIPMTYMPFGGGPHNCIGLRLALLLIKIGLVHILKNHTVEMCPETPKEIVFDPRIPTLQSCVGITLRIVEDKMYDLEA